MGNLFRCIQAEQSTGVIKERFGKFEERQLDVRCKTKTKGNVFISVVAFVQYRALVMSAYGYEIVQTLIVEIEPDKHVKWAMNDISAGKVPSMVSYGSNLFSSDSIVIIYLQDLRVAESEKAEAEKLLHIKRAEGEAEAKYLSGLGSQYFDTVKEIGAASKSSAIFIPHGPGAVRNVATQIRDDLLQASHQ
ncbi:hypothetical protein Patl1_17853 [Pistacia atlantica]|uniref:Uncharacterized protein n=1 Tax=Pistacia atlantica TaxID=434234 RepID=A0ACC1C1K4_9ROSI|nr:hypothetical protein Patl1_17853 [Pistacia atlantica]